MQATGKTVTRLHCHAEHTEAHHERVAYNCELHGPWAGWRMAGRDLVWPDGDRIKPRRLAGILWTERARAQGLAKPGYAKCSENFPILSARERFVGSA